ncbi:hypothetical protein NPIL_174481, partial [Nephila pilipes]
MGASVTEYFLWFSSPSDKAFSYHDARLGIKITYQFRREILKRAFFIALIPLPRREVIKNDPEKSTPPLRNALPGFTLAA